MVNIKSDVEGYRALRAGHCAAGVTRMTMPKVLYKYIDLIQNFTLRDVSVLDANPLITPLEL